MKFIYSLKTPLIKLCAFVPLCLCTYSLAYAVNLPLFSEGMDYYVNVQGKASLNAYGDRSSLRLASETEKKLINWNDPLTELYVAEGLLYLELALQGEPTEFDSTAQPRLTLDAYVYSVVSGKRSEAVDQLTLGQANGNILSTSVDLMSIMTKGQVLVVNYNYSLGDTLKTTGYGQRKLQDLLKESISDYSSETNRNTIARVAIVYLPAIRIELQASESDLVLGSSFAEIQPESLVFTAKVLERYTGDPELGYPLSFRAPSDNYLSLDRGKTNLQGEVKTFAFLPRYETLTANYLANLATDYIQSKTRVEAVAFSAGQEHLASVTINTTILAPKWDHHFLLNDDLAPEAKLILLDKSLAKLFLIKNNNVFFLHKTSDRLANITETIDNFAVVIVRVPEDQWSKKVVLQLIGKEKVPAYTFIGNGRAFVPNDLNQDYLLFSTHSLKGELLIYKKGQWKVEPFEIEAGKAKGLRL